MKDHFLYPQAGRVYGKVNPYDKTVYFERETDWGPEPCDRPEGAVIQNGYRVIPHPRG